MTVHTKSCRARTTNKELVKCLKKVRKILKKTTWVRQDEMEEDWEEGEPMSLHSAILVATKTSYHFDGHRSEMQGSEDNRRYYALVEELTSIMPVSDALLFEYQIQEFEDNDETTEEDIFRLIDDAIVGLEAEI